MPEKRLQRTRAAYGSQEWESEELIHRTIRVLKSGIGFGDIATAKHFAQLQLEAEKPNAGR